LHGKTEGHYAASLNGPKNSFKALKIIPTLSMQSMSTLISIQENFCSLIVITNGIVR